MANVCIAVPSASLSIGGGAALPAEKKETTIVKVFVKTLFAAVRADEVLSLFVYTGRAKRGDHTLIVSIARSLCAPFRLLGV